MLLVGTVQAVCEQLFSPYRRKYRHKFWKIASGDLLWTVFIPSVADGTVGAQDTDHKTKCQH